MGSVGDLHGRRIGVAISSDDLDTESLELDHDLLAEFTGAKEQDLGGRRGEGSADIVRIMGHRGAPEKDGRAP